MIEWIGAEHLVGGADIEQHRQQALWRDRRTRRIELQLADRDSHAVGADIAEAEDTASCRNADETYIPLRPAAQNFDDPSLHCTRDIHAPRASIDLAEGHTAITNARAV